MRLVSWNVHGSAGPDIDQLAAALHDLDPDVIALQEVQRRQARMLARILGQLDWRWALKHRPFGWLVPWRAEGLAVMSRAPITSTAWVELSTGGWLAMHRRRIAMYADTTADGRAIRVINAHLGSGRDEVERRHQADRLVASSWLTTGPPAVLVGDLNTAEALPAFAVAALEESDSAVQATFPSDHPRRRIDRVLVGAESPATICRVEVPEGLHWARLSDHRPLVVVLSLA
ncbi:MAG: endonuclease/exonuclease/phosphatase family protein [Candidatus Nanopelagicales bacterium]